jgi:excisionase family DNA binding protein
MFKNVDPGTLADVILKAVLAALSGLEPTPKLEITAPLSPTVSQAEFSANTGLGINRVNELVRAGRIKHVRLGARNVRIPRAELTEFFERESQGGAK